MDDASDFDYHDLPHPIWGPQRSMAGIVADFVARHGVPAHATVFAVVSPEARAELDRSCLIGCRWWNHDWWQDAEAGGLIAIESHGWDHNHDSLSTRVADVPAGRFDLQSRDAADAEIANASIALRQFRGRGGEVLFAYPYGQGSGFLVWEYLAKASHHGIYAAFSTVPEPVTPETSRWVIPRYVSGWHWKSPSDLEALLRPFVTDPLPSPMPSRQIARKRSWRESLRTWEIHDARIVAGDLFKRCFGHELPDYPRHFVLVYSPEPGMDAEPKVVAYVHQLPFGSDVHLCGGMCVDERAYRRFPKWLFEEVKREGGLATMVTRDSMAMLRGSVASFGHVGEPRARAADLRTGFVDTDHPHLMVMWLQDLAEGEKRMVIEKVAAHGPF